MLTDWNKRRWPRPPGPFRRPTIRRNPWTAGRAPESVAFQDARDEVMLALYDLFVTPAERTCPSYRQQLSFDQRDVSGPLLNHAATTDVDD